MSITSSRENLRSTVPSAIPSADAHAVAHAEAEAEARAGFAAHIAETEFPCLGARSVMRRDAADIVVLKAAGPAELHRLGRALAAFTVETADAEDFVSFVAIFRDPIPASEADFEAFLWRVLQHLHDTDDRPWADDVSSDPGSPHFEFSHAGTPLFVVGLHPEASRMARRTPLPTLVFNLHRQFEQMRADGHYDRMRDQIRRRDVRLQGSVNPMVDDFGSTPPARQYSGRAVEDGWVAPFCPHGESSS